MFSPSQRARIRLTSSTIIFRILSTGTITRTSSNNPLRYTDPLGLLEYDTKILNKQIHVHIDDNLTEKRQNELKAKLDSAITNVNGNATKLTDSQKAVVGNINSIDVSGAAPRSYVLEFDRRIYPQSRRCSNLFHGVPRI